MATPVKVIRIKEPLDKTRGRQGLRVKVTGDKTVDISLTPDVKVGDWLLVHGNLAVNKISDEEAKNIFGLIKKCGHQHEHTHSHRH